MAISGNFFTLLESIMVVRNVDCVISFRRLLCTSCCIAREARRRIKKRALFGLKQLGDSGIGEKILILVKEWSLVYPTSKNKIEPLVFK